MGDTATTGVSGGTSQGNSEDPDNSDDENESRAFKGISMKEFSKLVIPKSVMQDGILFIWVEKEYVMDVCKFLEEQQFYYVENMVWVMLDETMKDGKPSRSLIFRFRGRKDSHPGRHACLCEGGLHLPQEVQEDSPYVPPHLQGGRGRRPRQARAQTPTHRRRGLRLEG